MSMQTQTGKDIAKEGLLDPKGSAKAKGKSPVTVPRTRPTRTRQDYLDFVSLAHATQTTPSRVESSATKREKAAEREHRLRARTTKHRTVFFNWPRDPKGETIYESKGKTLPNRIEMWGNSLFDFYYVERIPGLPSFATVTTASKLANWMKEHGELFAKDQLLAAAREPMPQEVLPYPIAPLLDEYDLQAISSRDGEPQSPSGFMAEFKKVRAVKTFVVGNDGKERPAEVEFGSEKPFNPDAPAPILSERIPLRLLPKTLLVHDPYKILSPRSRHERPSRDPKLWDAQPDIISTYRLKLSTAGLSKVTEENEAIKKAQDDAAAKLKMFLDNPTADTRPLDRGVLFVPQGSKPGPCAPAVFFMHGERPTQRQPVDEAHLYLSPNELVGEGHHSHAYNVELEVPRTLLVEEYRLCKSCVFEKGIKILAELDGEDGENEDDKWKGLSGSIIETVEEDPGMSVLPTGHPVLNDGDGEDVLYYIEPPKRTVSKKYHGPVRVIDTSVQFQDPTIFTTLCRHFLSRGEFVVRDFTTARVRVVAKLMNDKADTHLPLEAKNYQAFPTHFFQHWSGLNILRPIMDPVPVGALVPQFYGYYTPDDDVPLGGFETVVGEGERMDVDEDGEGKGKGRDDIESGGTAASRGKGSSPRIDSVYEFRSPLLLVENCGKAVPSNMDELTVDEKQEMASLFLRFQCRGWLHQSVYTRNLLFQPGPISASPEERARNAAAKRRDLRQTSFRLIDFGRSLELVESDGSARRKEENEVLMMFGVNDPVV